MSVDDFLNELTDSKLYDFEVKIDEDNKAIVSAYDFTILDSGIVIFFDNENKFIAAFHYWESIRLV